MKTLHCEFCAHLIFTKNWLLHYRGAAHVDSPTTWLESSLYFLSDLHTATKGWTLVSSGSHPFQFGTGLMVTDKQFFRLYSHSLVIYQMEFLAYFYSFSKLYFWGRVQVKDGSALFCLPQALFGNPQRFHLHRRTGPWCLSQCPKRQGIQ